MWRVALAAVVLLGLVLSASMTQEVKKGVEEKKVPDEKKSEPKRTPDRDPGAVPERPAAEKVQPGEVEIHFLNGSNVRMVVESEKLEVATMYGKLSVPVKDVRAIEFGVHYPPGYLVKIDGAVRNLSSGSYRQREQASKLLIDLGPYSFSAVHGASQSKDLETARRASEILKKLKTIHPKKDLKSSEDDKVVTPTFTIVGRILTPTIHAKTEYFGEVVLSLGKMRTLRAVGAQAAEVDVGVDASKYANAGQWLETTFECDGRTSLAITAKGLVDTWPQQPGQYMVGPNGVRAGMAGGGMVIRRVAGPIAGQVYGGVLFGKVGADGEAFIIGDRYEGTPDATGKLFLHIGPSPYNCPSAGTYEVKIRRN